LKEIQQTYNLARITAVFVYYIDQERVTKLRRRITQIAGKYFFIQQIYQNYFLKTNPM